MADTQLLFYFNLHLILFHILEYFQTDNAFYDFVVQYYDSNSKNSSNNYNSKKNHNSKTAVVKTTVVKTTVVKTTVVKATVVKTKVVETTVVKQQ